MALHIATHNNRLHFEIDCWRHYIFNDGEPAKLLTGLEVSVGYFLPDNLETTVPELIFCVPQMMLCVAYSGQSGYGNTNG